MTPDNAQWYRFYASAPASAISASQPPSSTVPENLILGPEQALEELQSRGCRLATQSWVDNAWGLVLWKLAALVALDPQSEAGGGRVAGQGLSAPIPKRANIKRTLAPTTPTFIPARNAPLRIARTIGASTATRTRYQPSVISTSGCSCAAAARRAPSGASSEASSAADADGHEIPDTHKTMGRPAGLSCAAMSRKGGRTPALSSRSYLHRRM